MPKDRAERRDYSRNRNFEYVDYDDVYNQSKSKHDYLYEGYANDRNSYDKVHSKSSKGRVYEDEEESSYVLNHKLHKYENSRKKDDTKRNSHSMRHNSSDRESQRKLKLRPLVDYEDESSDSETREIRHSNSGSKKLSYKSKEEHRYEREYTPEYRGEYRRRRSGASEEYNSSPSPGSHSRRKEDYRNHHRDKNGDYEWSKKKIQRSRDRNDASKKRTSTPIQKYNKGNNRQDYYFEEDRSRSKSTSRYKRKRSDSRGKFDRLKKSKYDDSKLTRSSVVYATSLAAELKKKRQELMRQGNKVSNDRPTSRENHRHEETIVIDDDSFRTDESMEERQVPDEANRAPPPPPPPEVSKPSPPQPPELPVLPPPPPPLPPLPKPPSPPKTILSLTSLPMPPMSEEYSPSDELAYNSPEASPKKKKGICDLPMPPVSLDEEVDGVLIAKNKMLDGNKLSSTDLKNIGLLSAKKNGNNSEVVNLTSEKRLLKRMRQRNIKMNEASGYDWGDRFVDAFDISSQVGEGMYGRVFKATDKTTGQVVALKKVRMEHEKDGFPITTVREMKCLRQLNHENIVKLMEVITERQEGPNSKRDKDGQFYLVFEFMDHDLMGLLNSGMVTLSEGNIANLMSQLLSGLSYCHEKNYLHRDIKCSNILLNNRGQLKLADFGLARSYLADEQRLYTNKVITLWYRPPELLLGEESYDAAVDVWSCGCILGELFIKKALFQAPDEMTMVDVISRVCGTPCPAIWPNIDKLRDFRMYQPKKIYKRRLREEFATMPKLALDLLDKMLTLYPKKRISSMEAFNDPWFKSISPSYLVPPELPKDLSCHEMWCKKRRKEKNASLRKEVALPPMKTEATRRSMGLPQNHKLNNSTSRDPNVDGCPVNKVNSNNSVHLPPGQVVSKSASSSSIGPSRTNENNHPTSINIQRTYADIGQSLSALTNSEAITSNPDLTFILEMMKTQALLSACNQPPPSSNIPDSSVGANESRMKKGGRK